jgi:hypothetical protein
VVFDRLALIFAIVGVVESSVPELALGMSLQFRIERAAGRRDYVAAED